MLAVLITLIGPNVAVADTTSDNITAGQVLGALDSTDAENGDLVGEPVPSKTDGDSAAVVQQHGSVTDIPKDATDGIGLTGKDGSNITIELPNADDADKAQRVDGTVVYPSNDGSASAVVPTNDGVQVLNTITSLDAPTRYDYNVSVPEGGSVEETADGFVQILDADGKGLFYVALPWAKDADGNSVPTHFEVEGTKLVQVVDHNTGEFAYPVVADPRFYYSWGIYTVKFNSNETGYISRAGGAAIGAYLGGPGAAFFTALGGDWLADVAASRRMCLVYRVVPWYIWASGLWIERC